MRSYSLAIVALLSLPLSACADTLQYTFSAIYPNYPTHTFSFQLPRNPTPDQLIVNTSQGFLAVKDVQAIADGVLGKYLAVFNFNQVYELPITGGDLILAGPFYNSSQPTFTYRNSVPLYSGSEFAPTFLTGTFVLQEFGAPYGGSQGLLTVTNITTAVTPEPSTLLLSFTGLLAVTTAILRRRVLQG